MDLLKYRGRSKDVGRRLDMEKDMDPGSKATGENPLGPRTIMKMDGR